WPGNVRELENVLERAVILATGPTLEVAPDLLPTSCPAEGNDAPATDGDEATTAPAVRRPPDGGAPRPTLEDVERDYILTVLRETNWVITGPRGAAKVLGINPSTLRNRMKKFGISRQAR